uniref:Uncharacterized protein n=1 Tax=Tanacetum cinerariifolium TaxID=118510 RepID=A0A699HHM8_TANCI|nr:hypothetical protein [Tanacetum cinerariifolium]
MSQWFVIQNLHEVDYDQLYDYLKQNDNNVNALRAKRAIITHDPFAFIANHYVVPSPSHTSPVYYVTHPTLVNDFDGYTQSYEFKEKHVMMIRSYENALGALRATRTHDPLVLVANHYVVPSPSHTSPAYYVTHHTLVNDFDGYTQSYEFKEKHVMMIQ